MPQLIDESMKRARYYRSALIDDPDFILPDLNIYVSTIIYDVSDDFSFNKDFRVKNTSPYRVSYISQININSPLVVLIVINKPIEWANREIYIENYLDIHILYHIPEKKLLFELTSSEDALDSITESLYIGNIDKISYSKLYKALSKFEQENYIMVGMKNAVMPGTSHPSYKTFIGDGVQDTIRNSEGRIFGVGHALMKMGEKKTWGITTKRSRVWAMKRGNLDEYKSWCDDLAELLDSSIDSSMLPGLSFLASTSPINKLDEVPVAILPDDVFFKSEFLHISIKGGEIYTNVVSNIEIMSFESDSGNLICALILESFSCQLIMNFDNPLLWTVRSDKEITIRLIKSANNVITANLEKIINTFPPTLIMPKGYIVEGRTKIMPNSSIENIPDEVWIEKDWSDCKITAEAYKKTPKPKSLPVINIRISCCKIIMEEVNLWIKIIWICIGQLIC